MEINTNEMSEKEFSNLIKQLLSKRYPEANRINIDIWSYSKSLDSIKIVPTYEFK